MKRLMIFFLGFLWLFLCGSLALSQPASQPVAATTLQVPQRVQVPATIKDVRLTTPISLKASEKKQLNNATKLLVNQHFKNLVEGSKMVRSKVTVLGRVGTRIQSEAIVVFLAQKTYTATISKLNYELEGDKVYLKSKTDNYAPLVTTILTPTAVDSLTIQLKSDLLANLKISLPQGWGPTGLANTPCDDISTAVSCTNTIYNTFKKAFESAQKRIGSSSTKPAILDILKKGNRLLAWNNIGHGNPSCIVQWDGEPIWDSDFNSTTPFKGVYKAVILLNSCHTCASPYKLKNAIMKHKPRTYIAGNTGLPIGSSEYVDVYFWDYTLLQDKTMGWALAKAQSNKGLSGYFCLIGDNTKFTAAKITEDCISFDPKKVQAKEINGRWKVVHGSMWMLDFSSHKDQALRAVKIIKYYKFDRQCFVGRPNAPMQYYTVKGKAPQGAFSGEDCVSFNPANVKAVKINGRWKVVDGSNWLLDFDDKKVQAETAVKIIKFYGFNRICFVGRPNAPMMYFRK